jgi:CubicO group peptidase (beta-lactamase class C family)
MSRRVAIAIATLAAQAGAYAPRPEEHDRVIQAERIHEQSECIPVTAVLTTGSWGSEVSWSISSTRSAFRPVASEAYANRPRNKKHIQQECLPATTEYTITMMDSYGDGWNGGSISIYAGTFSERDTLPARADFSGLLDSGSSEVATFTLPLPRGYTPPPPPDALDVAMQAKLEEWKLLGFSVAIFKRGHYSEPIARGYGKTHADPAQAGPVTGDTVQMIASMSKTVLGAAVTKLIDAGDIKVDDDIKEVLPSDWTPVGTSRNPKDPDLTPVTYRHIMTHTSSMTRDVQYMQRSYGPTGVMGKIGNDHCPITDLSGFYGDYLMDRGITTTVGQDGSPFDWYHEAQKKGGAWDVADKPGAVYQYSNFATGYLGFLVEQAAAKSTNFRGSPTFPEFCKQEIFDVLDMKNTAWFRQDLPRDVSEATPARWSSGGHDSLGHYCFVDYASGQLHSSARDLAKFGQAWLEYGGGRGGFISAETGKKAVGCASRNPDGSIPADGDCEMGYLWFRMTNDKRDSGEGAPLDPVRGLDWSDGIAHSGSEAGVQTNMFVLPKAGLVAVVLTNGKGHAIGDRSFMHEIMGTLLDSAPLTWGPTEATWPTTTWATPSPAWSNPNRCCTTVTLKATIDAEAVEEARPGVLGEYVLTDKHTKSADTSKVWGVYEKKGPSAGTRGNTLSMDPLHGDWRVFGSNPVTDPAKPNMGSFYSWSGGGAVCPEMSTQWKVKMGNSPYTGAHGLTVQCA